MARRVIEAISRLGTWRNTLRASGLITMLWLIWTRAHPDPSALLFCGAMIGLPSFVQSDKKDDAS